MLLKRPPENLVIFGKKKLDLFKQRMLMYHYYS